MKAILIRVGIDSGYGGDVGPIFNDGIFEYIPIPEYEETSEVRKYSNTKGKSGILLSNFVSKIFKNMKIHFDPEFNTYTYGDHSKKTKIFQKLEKGDYLIFYAGLRPYNNSSYPRGLYIIGFFYVDKAYDYNDLLKADIKNLLKNNAHIKRGDIEGDTVVVKGDLDISKLLKKAIRIARKEKSIGLHLIFFVR